MPTQQAHIDLIAALATSRKLWLDISDAATYPAATSGPITTPIVSDKDEAASFAFEAVANTASTAIGTEAATVVESFDSSTYFTRPNALDLKSSYAMCPEYVLTDSGSTNGAFTWSILSAVCVNETPANTTQPYAIWLCGFNADTELVSGNTDSFRPSYFPGSNVTTGLYMLIDPASGKFELYLVTPGYDGTTSLDGVIPLTRPNGLMANELTDRVAVVSVKSTRNYSTGATTFTVHLNGAPYSKAELVRTDEPTSTYDITTSRYIASAFDALGKPSAYSTTNTQTVTRANVLLDEFKVTCIGTPMLYGTYGGTYLYGDTPSGTDQFEATFVDPAKTGTDRPMGVGYLCETMVYSAALSDTDLVLLHNYLHEKWIIPISAPTVTNDNSPTQAYTKSPVQFDVEVRTAARDAKVAGHGLDQTRSDSLYVFGSAFALDGSPLVDNWTITQLSTNYTTHPSDETITTFRITGTTPETPGTFSVDFVAGNFYRSMYNQWQLDTEVSAHFEFTVNDPPVPVVSDLSITNAQVGSIIAGTFTATDTNGVEITNVNPNAPNFTVEENVGVPDGFVLNGRAPNSVSRFVVAVNVKQLNDT